ncbi:hypothetical protein GPALN_002242 [Globodera pallida]|nr:hypothetical protein GPALN_002242 [Globodera pallida]
MTRRTDYQLDCALIEEIERKIGEVLQCCSMGHDSPSVLGVQQFTEKTCINFTFDASNAKEGIQIIDTADETFAASPMLAKHGAGTTSRETIAVMPIPGLMSFA